MCIHIILLINNDTMQLYIDFRAIPTENKGHKLLAKMGWKEGEGLGKANAGIQQPVSGIEVPGTFLCIPGGKVNLPPLR